MTDDQCPFEDYADTVPRGYWERGQDFLWKHSQEEVYESDPEFPDRDF